MNVIAPKIPGTEGANCVNGEVKPPISYLCRNSPPMFFLQECHKMGMYPQFINICKEQIHENAASSSLKQPSEAHCIEFLSQPVAVGLAIRTAYSQNWVPRCGWNLHRGAHRGACKRDNMGLNPRNLGSTTLGATGGEEAVCQCIPRQGPLQHPCSLVFCWAPHRNGLKLRQI